MNFDDRLGWLLLGCFIGFVFGYIVRYLREIKNELEEVDDFVKTTLAPETKPSHKQNEEGLVRYPLVLDFALLCVVLITVWAAFASQKASNDIKEAQHRYQVGICKSGEDTRAVQRSIVEAVYNLAGSVVQRDDNSPALTTQERKQINNYINKVNNFRSSMYKKIRPSSICAPYVNDDKVGPSTPPYPPFKP